jgi:hypothetical protein
MNRIAAGLLAGLLLVQAAPARAADPPAVGGWLVYLPLQGNTALWMVRVDLKDGKPAAAAFKNPALQNLPEMTVENLSTDDGLLKFTLKARGHSIPVEARLPKEGDKALGTGVLDSKTVPVRLVRTNMKEFDAFEFNKIVVAQQAGEPQAVEAALELVGLAAEKKAKPDEVRGWADKAVEWAKPYGPGWQNEITLSAADSLSDQEGFADLAVEYARKAEKALTKGDKPAYQRRVLKVLAAALTKAKKDDEAKAVTERMEKIDVLAVTPYPGRKGDSDRVAVVELFTGAQCPPCVAADVAFDALNKCYKPTDVVFLEYHLHIPGPDPLTSKGSEERMKFYGKAIRGTPTMFVNGKLGPAPGGFSDEDAQDKYDSYNGLLKEALEKPSKAKLKMQVVKKDGKINARAEVSDLAESGPDVRLRLAVVEEKIDYTGGNKVTSHHDVVRAFVGDGAEGTPMPDKTGKKTVVVDLDDIRKGLETYVKENGPYFGKEPSIDLKKLRLVAFVQNDETGEILQAAQIDLPTE